MEILIRDLSEKHLVLSQQSVKSLVLDVGEAVDGELDASLPQQDRPHLDVLQICHLWKIVSVTFVYKAFSRKCYLAEIVDKTSFVDKVETGGCSKAGGVVMIAVYREHRKPDVEVS